jgi:MFS transporter, MHS family, proline/betaine transporter
MGLYSTLNHEQKEALGLLQIGTFLEYFDLMLYIHMAVLLNDLFFPKTDSQTAALLAAFAFCSTYVMRPIGALIFGWLGDNIGRKSTIIITTVMMSISCLLMANLPTYEQIGMSAAWIITFCRIFQGMSSMGEIVGAEIYVAEFVSRPASYPAVALVSVSAYIGATVALGIASLVTFIGISWRSAFWIGAGVALIGAVARTRLRETPDFLEMKRKKMKEAITQLSHNNKRKKSSSNLNKTSSWKEPIEFKTLLSYFLIFCGWPLSFYLAYMYFNPLLMEKFGYSSKDIIQHNFLLSFVNILSGIFWALLSHRIHPIKLMKIRWIFTLILMISLPLLIMGIKSSFQLYLIQSLILFLSLGSLPGEAVFYYHLPIYRRFTLASFLYALSRALMYIITSISLVYLGNYFGNFGIWFITLPITLAYIYGVYHFQILESKLGIYPNLVSSGTEIEPEHITLKIHKNELSKA